MLVWVKFRLYELVFQKRLEQIGSEVQVSSSSGVSIDLGIDTGETKPLYTSWGLCIFFFEFRELFTDRVLFSPCSASNIHDQI